MDDIEYLAWCDMSVDGAIELLRVPSINPMTGASGVSLHAKHILELS